MPDRALILAPSSFGVIERRQVESIAAQLRDPVCCEALCHLCQQRGIAARAW